MILSLLRNGIVRNRWLGAVGVAAIGLVLARCSSSFSSAPVADASAPDSGADADAIVGLTAECKDGNCDCNHDASDGLEVAVDMDPANCGACRRVCPPPSRLETAKCVHGACTAAYVALSQLDPAAIVATNHEVFWGNKGVYAGSPKGSVMKAPLDGGAGLVIAADVEGAGNGLALDATHVYWAKGFSIAATGGIGRALRDCDASAGCAEDLSTPAYALGIAVDDKMIYWLRYDGAPSKATLVEVDKDTKAPHDVISALESAWALAIDGDQVFVTAAGPSDAGPFLTTKLRNCPTVGPCDPRVLANAAEFAPLGIASDGKSIYWSDPRAGTINKRSKLIDGTQTVTVLASGQNNPGALVLDGTDVYWVNMGDGGANGSIMRTGTDGKCPSYTPCPQTLATGFMHPLGIAVNDHDVVFTVENTTIGGGPGTPAPDGEVRRVPK